MASIGIIVPAYNAQRFITRTIDSIRGQTIQDWQCIVVDDCSTDNTREVADAAIEQDARFRLHAMPRNAGSAAARNAGLALLHGGVRYVIFLDSDDVWEPSALHTLIQAIEAKPAWLAVFGNCRAITEQGDYIQNSGIELAGQERFDFRDGRLTVVGGEAEVSHLQLMLRNPIISPGCLLLRIEAIRSLEALTSRLFDDRIDFAEDWRVWLRLRRLGRMGHVDQIVLDYRLHGANKTRRQWLLGLAARKARMAALSDPTLSAAEFRQACVATRAYRMHRIREYFRQARTAPFPTPARARVRALKYGIINLLDIVSMHAFEAAMTCKHFFVPPTPASEVPTEEWDEPVAMLPRE
jgi:GT2 family glycosyltransferase